MTPRLMLLPLAFALVATVTFASAEGEEAAATEKEMVLDPTTGEMVTAPEYGGTIRAVVNFKNEGIDPYYRYTAGAWIGLVNEKLGVADWAIDRSVVGYTTLFLPDEAIAGQLAESWENPDPLTYIFKIRDGVFWHDKAPVNGRQLTAHDVAYSWQRLLFGVDGGESSPDCPGGFDICNIVDAEGRPARHRAAVDHQGTDRSPVRCHDAVDQGLQRGRRSRRDAAVHRPHVPLGGPGYEAGDGLLSQRLRRRLELGAWQTG